MSAPGEDTELDEYLAGGSEISRRYRLSMQAQADREPPPALDRAVLSQARFAVQPPAPRPLPFPQRRSAARWIVPLAAAATVIVSFAVFHEAGMENVAVRHDGLRSQQITVPMSVTTVVTTPAQELPQTQVIPEITGVAAPASIASVDKTASVADSSRVSPEALEQPKSAVELDMPPPPGLPVAASVSSNEEIPELKVEAQRQTSPQEMLVVPAHSGGSAKLMREHAAAQAAAPQPRKPEQWIADIRKLRADGHTQGADAELKRFLAVYPDYFEKHPGVQRP